MSSVLLYHFEDYKVYVNAWVANQPRKGFGEYRRMSQALGVSTTMISQVFKADKHLSLELASDLCDYLRLDDDETDYFFLLVEHGRAGSTRLRKRLLRQVKARQEKAKKLENRVKVAELSEVAKTVFYSSWIYQGVRLLSDLAPFNDAETIAERLHLPRNQVQKVLDFLVQNGLVVSEKGKLKPGPARTHIGSSGALVSRHHQNWRLQGFNQMIQSDEEQFFYTGPLTVSTEVATWIRQELPAFVERINARVMPSPSEETHCLNIDWFKF